MTHDEDKTSRSAESQGPTLSGMVSPSLSESHVAGDGTQICRRRSGLDEDGLPVDEEVVAFDPSGKLLWSWSPNR